MTCPANSFPDETPIPRIRLQPLFVIPSRIRRSMSLTAPSVSQRPSLRDGNRLSTSHLSREVIPLRSLKIRGVFVGFTPQFMMQAEVPT